MTIEKWRNWFLMAWMYQIGKDKKETDKDATPNR